MFSTEGCDDVEVEGETVEGKADAVNVEHQGMDEMQIWNREDANSAAAVDGEDDCNGIRAG